MRVLVTGSAGFIGSPVVDVLREHGHESVGYDVRADPGADVRDPVAVARAPAGVDGVCHQVRPRPWLTVQAILARLLNHALATGW